MTKARQQLPKGWIIDKVGALYDLVGGGTPSTKVNRYWTGKIPWITSADIIGLQQIIPRKAITEEAIESSATNLVPPGTIIAVTRVGLGKIAITDRSICFSQDCQGLIDKLDGKFINDKYALYYLSTAVQEFKFRNRGTTISGVTKKQLSDLPFILPPIDEQRRIVEALEELLSDLDNGVDILKSAQRQLWLYRQAVLRWAFEGKFTAKWREEKKRVGKLETGQDLLALVSNERATRYQIAMNEWHEKVKEWEKEETGGRKPSRPRKPNPTQPTFRSSVHEHCLPSAWEVATLDFLSELVTDGDHNPPKRTQAGVPYLTARHVLDGTLSQEDCTFVSPDDYKQSQRRYKPQKDDVVLTCVGTLGRTALVPADFEFCADRNLAIIRLLQPGLMPSFLRYFLETPSMQEIIHSSSGSTAQPHLYLRDIRKFLVPVPSIAEQRELIQQIESRLSVCEHFEKVIENVISETDYLRQAILKHAFQGKLVTQNLKDEPAVKSLARIEAERVHSVEVKGFKGTRV